MFMKEHNFHPPMSVAREFVLILLGDGLSFKFAFSI